MAGLSSAKRERSQIEWQRNKVHQLLVRGYSQYETADTLKISQPTISRDLEFLRKQAHEDLQNHIQQRLPEEYRRCLAGIDEVLKLSWKIADNNNGNGRQSGQDHNDNSGNTLTTGDDRTRLQALSLLKETYDILLSSIAK